MTYEDAAMKEKNIEIPVELDVKEKSEDASGELPENMEEPSDGTRFSGPLRLSLMIGGVLVSGAILLLIRRGFRKKKLREEVADEDGWDEEDNNEADQSEADKNKADTNKPDQKQEVSQNGDE